MTPDPHDPNLSPADVAVSARLARLRTMPVDTSRLERSLRAALPALVVPHATSSRRTWLRPTLALAASLLVIATVLAFFLAGNPLQAAVDPMIQLHEDIVAGRVKGAVPVATIGEANAFLARSGPEALRFPRPPADELHACCFKPDDNHKVACLLLDYDHTPVTMSVAKAGDIPAPRGDTTVRDGVTYYLHAAQGYQMVMTRHQDTWICLVAKLPPDDLIALASKLQF